MEGDERFWVYSNHSQTGSVARQELSEKTNKYCTNFFILQWNYVELFLKKKNIGLFHFHFFNKNKQYFYYHSTWKFNCKFMHLTHKIKSTLQSMISTSNNIESLKLLNSIKCASLSRQYLLFQWRRFLWWGWRKCIVGHQ